MSGWMDEYKGEWVDRWVVDSGTDGWMIEGWIKDG